MVEEAFLHGAGSSASVTEPVIGVIFIKVLMYILLFQQRGVAMPDRIIRLVCVRTI